MLAQTNITDAIASGELKFSGSLRGNALLLTLGGPIQLFANDGPPIDPYDDASVASLYGEMLTGWAQFTLPAGESVLAQVREEMWFGPSLAGMIGTLSHVARLGLSTHLDSHNVDANFSGWLTLELTNAGPRPLILRPGMPVAKVTIFRLEGTSGGRPRRIFYGEQGSLRSRFPQEFNKGRSKQ